MLSFNKHEGVSFRRQQGVDCIISEELLNRGIDQEICRKLWPKC